MRQKKIKIIDFSLRGGHKPLQANKAHRLLFCKQLEVDFGPKNRDEGAI